MLALSVLVAAVTPGVALLFYFYLKDKYDAEPLHLVVRVFLLGFLIVLPITIVQQGLMQAFGDNPYLFAFGISSAVEEAFKWFVLLHFIYNHTEFDEPYDGILYAVAVSLGFATFENILYAFTLKASFGALLIRGLLPVSGHAMFGVVMGYYMGRAKFAGSAQTRKFLALSLLLPFMWHGIYDTILNTSGHYWLWYIIPFMVLMWYGGMDKVVKANNRSPFRFLRKDDHRDGIVSGGAAVPPAAAREKKEA
ncbi:glutamic-type intramembrane protease PrsW [Saccharibacillus sp. CPCC 101409]|uniref:glutamic-type intramembrane protease PrsW n=1 Tax=Saccharibacillus sp. CPCC 101409 TaxID=3058041 RepID=UPI00267130EE|nr:glutamic-type intramembrane protease PrsW [Saccharibacillus sp. CPCC 101409]MDO3409591.1 glutamic-type intramembrane protease PrsW [Saccharibacillus sp. CPCC 101409]